MADDVVIQILNDPYLLLEARQLQGQRFLDSGFVGRLSRDGVVDDPWVAISTYFGALNENGEVVGVARLIPHTSLGLPALLEFDLTRAGAKIVDEIPVGRFAEVSALAVMRGAGAFRSGRIANALYRAMYQYSVVTAGHTHWCAALDVRVKVHLMSSHNFLFEPIGSAREYLGSMTVPVTLDLLGQARHFAHTAPERNRYFLSGLVIDLTGDEVELRAGSGEFLPADGLAIHE